MPCVWLKHNKSQIFLNVGILSPDLFEKLSKGENIGNPPMFKALIDTGAQKTCISENVAKTVGLVPIGKIKISGVSGQKYHNNYLFYIAFTIGIQNATAPSKMMVQVHAPKSPIQGAELKMANSAFDILLGMDILSIGSLAIEGNGTGSFSF